MANIVNLGSDPRGEDIGGGLAALTGLFFVKRQQAKEQEAADAALTTIRQTKTHDEAMQRYYEIPSALREKRPELRQAINDLHPGFDTVSAFTPDGTQKTFSVKKGSDPVASVVSQGGSLSGRPAAWGVDVPGIGVIPAPDEQTAKSISDTYQSAGQSAPVLNPNEIDIRLKSEQTEASRLNAMDRANALLGKGEAANRQWEAAYNARLLTEQITDPLTKPAGVMNMISDEENVASNFKTRFGTANASGAITMAPGEADQFGVALTTWQKLTARGMDPTGAFQVAELAGELSLNPGMLDETGDARVDATAAASFATKYKLANTRMNTKYGVGLEAFKKAAAVAEATGLLPEFDPQGNPEENISRIPIGNTGKAILVINVNGKVIPYGRDDSN